jgi:hypothetical protein
MNPLLSACHISYDDENVFRFVPHLTRRDWSRALASDGRRIATRSAMIDITTNSSINVKADLFVR